MNLYATCYSAIASERASEKSRGNTARLSAAAKNKARLRNRVRRAQQSDDLPLWKGWIWNSNDPNMGQHALWRDSPHAERRAAAPHRLGRETAEAAEAAFTLTKIDTLSDQLLSSQLRFTRKIIRHAVWIAPRYRNAAFPPPLPLSHIVILHESLEMESRRINAPTAIFAWHYRFLFKTASILVDIFSHTFRYL